LAGIVVSAVFGAVVALVKFVADPQNQLPTMVFWLMGSLASADYPRLILGAVATSAGLIVLWMLRFQLHVMSLGEDDAKAMGLPVKRVRTIALVAVALMTAASVAVCGVIGWVGLVIPHLVRLLFGSQFMLFIPLTAVLGAIYMVAVDTLARSLTDSEIPLGALTALVGAPLFAYLIRRFNRPEAS
jgi:iron complex transport system permease protein